MQLHHGIVSAPIKVPLRHCGSPSLFCGSPSLFPPEATKGRLWLINHQCAHFPKARQAHEQHGHACTQAHTCMQASMLAHACAAVLRTQTLAQASCDACSCQQQVRVTYPGKATEIYVQGLQRGSCVWGSRPLLVAQLHL